MATPFRTFKIDGYEFKDTVRVGTYTDWSDNTIASLKDIVYVYVPDEDHAYPTYNIAFKVGDGSAYLVDLPFNDDLYSAHIANTTVHITSAEREFWNNKVTAYLDAEDQEKLVLTKS